MKPPTVRRLATSGMVIVGAVDTLLGLMGPSAVNESTVAGVIMLLAGLYLRTRLQNARTWSTVAVLLSLAYIWFEPSGITQLFVASPSADAALSAYLSIFTQERAPLTIKFGTIWYTAALAFSMALCIYSAVALGANLAHRSGKRRI